MSENMKAQVECVFGLGGGELADGPKDGFPFAYWYEGGPDYMGRAEREAAEWCSCHGADGQDECPECNGHGSYEVRTVIADCLYGEPTLPAGWTKVQMFISSGEAECGHCGPGTEWDGSEAQTKATPDSATGYKGDKACKLCEGSGYVYIGDGWAEVVIRRAYPAEG